MHRFLYSLRHVLILAWLGVVVVLVEGCNGGNAVRAVPYEIPIRPVVVLASGEVIGNRNNLGCRWTEQEIRDSLKHLKQRASVFGSNTQIVWDESSAIQSVVDPYLGTTYSRPTHNFNFIGSLQDNSSAFSLDPDKLNVLFIGNIFDFSSGTRLLGFTQDPNTFSIPAFVAICDGGGRADSTGANWSNSDGSFVVEHECGHYLGDIIWAGKTFSPGGSQRVYDGAGHIDPSTSASGPYLMSPSAFLTSLYIPGKQVDTQGNNGADELGLLSKRLLQGRWNDPPSP